MATTQSVSVFLTTGQANQSEVVLAVHPEDVTLEIVVNDSDDVVSIDDVIWQYVTQPPPASGATPLTQPPAPEDVFLEVRFAPRNTPFPPPSSPSSGAASISAEAESASYANLGISPLVPNQPRLDAAFDSDSAPAGAAADVSRGYKYSVILTTQSQVYTLDPRVIIRRRRQTFNQ